MCNDPTVRSTAELVTQANERAAALESDMHWNPSDGGYGGYWQAESPELKSRIRARATVALDFLERFAGRDSQWFIGAQRIYEGNCDNQSMESGARGIADFLREWAHQVEVGAVRPRLVDEIGARAVVETDLMNQVRQLLADRSMSPVAAVVLAGAALEVALRSAVEELPLELEERPSISAYARRLREHDVLTTQDMKDVEQMAGLRNDAAHGNHEDISRERAGLMEQQVNLFLRRLEDRLTAFE